MPAHDDAGEFIDSDFQRSGYATSAGSAAPSTLPNRPPSREEIEAMVSEKQIKLALYQFEKSVEKINAHDDPELYCEAHYILGRLCEDEGDQDKAEKHFSDVLSVNYSFKDARERLERLQKGSEGQPPEEPLES